ncbi:MAG: O-antigen ligase family protein [Gammaproteobacteria bacterium]
MILACLLLIAFSIPISTVAVNVGFAFLGLYFAFSGNYQKKWRLLARHPIVLTTTFLFILLGVGTLYSAANIHDAANVWWKYRKLLYPILLIPFLQNRQWRRWVLGIFIAAMMLTLSVSFIDSNLVFKNHIAQNFLMAFTAYLLLQIAFHIKNNPLWQSLAALSALLAICNILFFVEGRTGYVVLTALLILTAWQYFHWKGIALGLVSAMLLLTFAFATSNKFHQRVLHTVNEIQTYKTSNAITSAGLRLEFYKKTIQIIQKNPLLGQGTGSLAKSYAALVTDKTGASSIKTHNPHNEYLMLTAQIGIIGLGIFLYLLFQLWKYSYQLPLFERHIAQGVIVAFVVGCTLNSMLLDFTEGHWFIFFIALLYAQTVRYHHHP